MAQILKGAPVAAALSQELTARAQKLKNRGVSPTLAILRLGSRPDDISYENGAMRRCAKIGIDVRQILLPEDCPQTQLLDAIRQINEDASIHGCLLLRPLPDKAMEDAVCGLLSPEKDVDGMTDLSLAGVFKGTGTGYSPCTAQACVEILKHYGIPLTGKRVAVVGRSLVIGRPVAMMLQREDATVTMCHTRTVDLCAICREAEIVIAAAGKAGVVDGSFATPNQVVVDVGIHVDENGKLGGDVKFHEVEPIVAAITPVPGGVGAVTTAVLAKHVIESAEKAAKG